MEKFLELAIEASVSAGRVIMEHYLHEDVGLETKPDNSPLTVADKRSNELINSYLRSSGIPIISEENEEISYEERKRWNKCWIVDPLDGTKEFINRNGEFTVNIALVYKGEPKLGVIFAPALGLLYFAVIEERKAYKKILSPKEKSLKEIMNGAVEIYPLKGGDELYVVGSRSHMNKDTVQFVENLKKVSKVQLVPRGSSLKFCLVAEGEAHYYPRFGPTMEWDTAAGQAICEAVGVSCKFHSSGKSITYNRESLRNGNFFVSYEG